MAGMDGYDRWGGRIVVRPAGTGVCVCVCMRACACAPVSARQACAEECRHQDVGCCLFIPLLPFTTPFSHHNR